MIGIYGNFRFVMLYSNVRQKFHSKGCLMLQFLLKKITESLNQQN